MFGSVYTSYLELNYCCKLFTNQKKQYVLKFCKCKNTQYEFNNK